MRVCVTIGTKKLESTASATSLVPGVGGRLQASKCPFSRVALTRRLSQSLYIYISEACVYTKCVYEVCVGGVYMRCVYIYISVVYI